PDIEAELNNLAMSKASQPLFDAVKKHIAENVEPIAEKFFKLGEGRKDPWSWAPGQLELLEVAKNKAKASGLWNFFLPTSEIGRGPTNLDYAYIAAELGKQPLASATLNCSAPDTGNIEALEQVGTPGVKILGPMHVFGHDHAPRGHMHLKFENARVPRENILLGEGRGFEISQVRLGPGRIHHCMRSIGAAEKALDLMVKRGSTRT